MVTDAAHVFIFGKVVNTKSEMNNMTSVSPEGVKTVYSSRVGPGGL